MTFSRNPRILMFAPRFPPLASAEAYAVGKLAIAFRRAGWKIDVVTVLPPKELYDSSPMWKELGVDSHHVVPSYGTVPLNIDRLVGAGRTFHCIRGVAWARHALRIGEALLKECDYDVILSRSRPVEGHLPAMTLANRRKIPWVAAWNDPEPPERYPAPYGGGKDLPLGLFMNHYMRSVSLSASWHLFCSERLREYMLSSWRYDNGVKKRSSVIPHIALTGIGRVYPRDGRCFTLCHAGEFNDKIRNPRSFFEGLELFMERRSTAKLELVLVGNSRVENVNFNISHRLKGMIRTTEWCSYQDSLAKMAEADVLVVIEAPMEEGVFLPSKAADYIQCRRPILAVSPKIGVMADILNEHGGGIAADCASAEECGQALGAFYERWKDGKLDEEYVSENTHTRFSESTVLDLYSNLIDRLLAEKR